MQKKVLLSLAVLSVSTIALAEDSSLKSLSYRVKGNEFHYNLGMEFGTSKFSNSMVDSTLTGAAATADTVKRSFENKATTWTNDFSYGVTDSFSIGLGLDLALSSKLNQKSESEGSTIFTGSSTAATNTTYSTLDQENNGLGDIRLNTSYRYMNDGIKGDLLAQVSISGKAKRAAINENTTGNYVVSEGDAKSGGSSILVGTQFAGAAGSFEWSTALALNYQMKKKITAVGGDVTSTGIILDYEQQTKSKLDFALGVAGQYNLTSAFSLGANVALNLVSKEETSYSQFDTAATKRDVTVTNKAHSDVTLGVEGKYEVTSNVMIGLNYAHVFGADIDGSASLKQSGTTTNLTLADTDRKDDRFGFDVSVRF